MIKPYYQDKWVTIYHGDCREILPQLDVKVDLVLTDPPYGVTSNKWDNIIDLSLLWGMSLGGYVFTSTQPYTTDLINSKRDWFKYEMIWRKQIPTGAFLAKTRPMKVHENILIFYDKDCTYNPIKIRRTPTEFKDSYRYRDSACKQGESFSGGFSKLIRKSRDEQWYKEPDTLLYFDSADTRDSSGHPTQKPVELFTYLIKTFSNETNLILDPFLGSGTTCYCAKKLNRYSIGIEIEEKYCEIAAKRCSQEVMELGI